MSWQETLLRITVALTIVLIADMVLQLAKSGVSDLVVGVVIGFFVATLDKIVALAIGRNDSKGD